MLKSTNSTLVECFFCFVEHKLDVVECCFDIVENNNLFVGCYFVYKRIIWEQLTLK